MTLVTTNAGPTTAQRSRATPASVQGRGALAAGNLRGHLVAGTVRFVSLAVIDLTVIASAQVLLRAVRGGLLGSAPAALTDGVLPLGAISSAQLAVAILLANLFLGSYRAGDNWRDPVRILTAAGLGVVLAHYSDIWHGNAAIVGGRGMLVWVVLGPLFVMARSMANVAARALFKNRLRHRVLEVIGAEATTSPPRLGPSYAHVRTICAHDLPAGVEGMERLLDSGVDTILVRGSIDGGRLGDLTDFALTHGCRLLCAPRTARLFGIDRKRVWMEGHPLSELTKPGLRASHLLLKRGLDILVAALTILILSPVLLAVALWVRLDSPGPVFFRQLRPGFQGRRFTMLKFRSMRSDAEEVLRANPSLYESFLQNDCKLPEDIDPRLTRSGRFIRKTSLDELPQLFNVLRGDMSLVGPRPLVGPELENYGGRVPTLLSVKPGITGPWQVAGRSRVRYPERAEIDLDYVRNWSFLGDLWILALTPAAVVLTRGAH